ncbi:hypothetical protein AURDEDRAFT_183479 [Auricularia subglabra TFB-10046 SS5]|nr:hypothetical protein AURDEDRAFT_183479 [Auricularia subglabra TFB-10046 SS5]
MRFSRRASTVLHSSRTARMCWRWTPSYSTCTILPTCPRRLALRVPHGSTNRTARLSQVLQSSLGSLRPVSWLYTSRLKIPVFENATPLRPKDGRWRLAIFSHGLAGNKTMYSQFCGNLASQGYVVLAMEHRDRTGMIHMSRDGQPRYYVSPEDVDWGGSQHSVHALRAEQLEFRRSEIYTAFSTFSKLVRGDDPSVHKLNGGPIDTGLWTEAAHVDEGIVLAGHSFGGCTALSILSTQPPEGHAEIPFAHALALDPWFEPLSTPGPMPTSHRESVPLCVINSQGFTVWKSHLPLVEKLVEKWPARSAFFTLINCRHDTFSDMYCLVPFTGQKFTKIFAAILSLSHAFLEDRLGIETETQPVVSMVLEEHEQKGKTVRTLKGEPGQIIVHKQ